MYASHALAAFNQFSAGEGALRLNPQRRENVS